MSEAPHDEQPDAAHGPEERRRARSSAPADRGKPEETPGGRPETPPGHGGTPPGQEGRPEKPDKPDEGDAAHPAHPIVEPDAPPATRTSSPAAPVEALLGWREFQAVMPRRASAATTVAALTAVRRWMQMQGHDIDGHYTIAQWRAYYAEAMRSTGIGVH